MPEHPILEAIRGRETETVPVAPLITLPHASRIAGIHTYEYVLDPGKYAEAQLHARRFYGYDWVFAHQIFQGLTSEERRGVEDRGDHFILRLELGTTFKLPKKGAPHIAERALKDKEDLASLEIPDMFHAERMRPIQLMKEAEEGAVFGNIRCPFTFASTFLYEPEDFYIALKKDEDFARELVEAAYEYCLQSGQAQIEAGVDAMFMEDPSASPDVVSPETFRSLAMPYVKRLISEFRKKVPVVFHVCGDTGSIIEDMMATGADCLSLDQCMDMAPVHERIPVWGNVEPRKLVSEGPEEIRRLSQRIVDLGRGVVLSSGCVVPPIAKPENIKEMVKTGHGD
ncbi:MAG: hypothetical protein D6733_02885 [Methanobacteriota archaeon]|nr:MAG: hypothetical protein D6733_02885 [Euryarchaeota archaeon]